MGKKYIGQTINPEQRHIQHKSSAFNNKDNDYDTPLHRAFRKYGYNNFKYEILDEANTIEELNGLEIYYIAHFKTQIPNGYNIFTRWKKCFFMQHTEEAKDKCEGLILILQKKKL